MAKITKILILMLAVISPLCSAQGGMPKEAPLTKEDSFMEYMWDEKSLGEINRGGVKCTFKVGGGESDQWMGHFEQDECFDKCMELKENESQIIGISVLTKRNKKGCWCLQRFSKRNNNKNYKYCILQGEGESSTTMGNGPEVIKSGGVTCEFKPGSGKNSERIGDYKQDECLPLCIKRHGEDSHINGMAVFADQTKKGCFCLQDMPNRNNNQRFKSCVLQGKGIMGKKVDEITAQGFKCKFVDGGGFDSTRIKGQGLRQNQCMVKCLENKEYNGVQVFRNQKKAGCWCLKGMPNRNNNKNYKSCVLEKQQKDFSEIHPYRYEVYDRYNMRDIYDMNKRNDMHDTYKMRDMYGMKKRNNMYDTYKMRDMYGMNKRNNMHDTYKMRDMYDMKKRNNMHDTYKMRDMYGMKRKQRYPRYL